jgi:hypothetical protein
MGNWSRYSPQAVSGRMIATRYQRKPGRPGEDETD